MARSGRVSFGHKGLQRALAKYGEEIEDEVKRIVVETALLIQSQAQASALYDEGNLRDSIEVEILNDGLTAIVIVGAHYAIYVEHGTGIYATGPGGSSAKKIPWVYFSDKLGRFVLTEGMKPTPFWFHAIDVGRAYFRKEMRKLGR